MQGIHVINDPSGQPAVLTIDLHNLDPEVSPFVSSMLGLLEQQKEHTERQEFLYVSSLLANRAYGDDEPEYTEDHLIERNPNYRPK